MSFYYAVLAAEVTYDVKYVTMIMKWRIGKEAVEAYFMELFWHSNEANNGEVNQESQWSVTGNHPNESYHCA